MKRFTTSAQKTVSLPIADILKKLETEMSKEPALVFQTTKRENIREAKLADGSKLVIAGFDKGDGKTLAMIDLKDLPGNNERATIQKSLRQRLDTLF